MVKLDHETAALFSLPFLCDDPHLRLGCGTRWQRRYGRKVWAAWRCRVLFAESIGEPAGRLLCHEQRHGSERVDLAGWLDIMPVVACFTLAALSLIFTSSSLAGIVDLQPMALPPELKNVAIASIHEDRGQFIIAGVANGGGCFVALLTRQLTLLALRSFPGIRNDYCGFASVDPAGDILVLGISRSPDFPFTGELQPGVSSIQFVRTGPSPGIPRPVSNSQ